MAADGNGKAANGWSRRQRTSLSDRRPHLRCRRGRRRRRRPARGGRLQRSRTAHRLHHQGISDALAYGRGAGRHLGRARQHARGQLALAYVRHRQGVGLARRSGFHRIHGAPGAGGGLRTRALGRAVLAHRGRQDLSAAVRRHDRGLRQGPGPAHLRRRRPHRPRHAAHHVRPGAAPFRGILYRVLRHRPDHGRPGHLPRRDRAEARRRHAASLPRANHHSRDRRLWAHLSFLHRRPHPNRRRQRDGAARRPAAAGHGIRAVPPDRHLRRRLSRHRRRARRGRLSRQFGGRALHGALCALRQGPRVARRRLARDDHRNPRGPRRRQEERPHLPAPRPSRSQGAARTAAGHFRIGEDIRQCRCDARADPDRADRALQHGRDSDQLPRRSADQEERRRQLSWCRA